MSKEKFTNLLDKAISSPSIPQRLKKFGGYSGKKKQVFPDNK